MSYGNEVGPFWGTGLVDSLGESGNMVGALALLLLTALLGALIAVCAFGIYTGHITAPKWLKRNGFIAAPSIVDRSTKDIVLTQNDIDAFEGMPQQFIDGNLEDLAENLDDMQSLYAQKKEAYDKLVGASQHWVKPSTSRSSKQATELGVTAAKEAMDAADQNVVKALRKYLTMQQAKEAVRNDGKIDFSITDDEIKACLGRSGKIGQELSAKFKAKGWGKDVVDTSKRYVKRKYGLSE